MGDTWRGPGMRPRRETMLSQADQQIRPTQLQIAHAWDAGSPPSSGSRSATCRLGQQDDPARGRVVDAAARTPRRQATSGSLKASGSSSAEPTAMQLQNTFLSPCTLSTRATGGQYFV